MSALSMTSPRGFSVAAINGRFHWVALNAFLAVVLAHWAEHVVQAYQVWVLDRPRPAARGVLGQIFPWLVTSEWLHYGYAIVMLVGLFLLRSGFVGPARTWWTVALVIQFWHHIEHLLLLIQAQTHTFFFGGTVPTSVAQVIVPRVPPGPGSARRATRLPGGSGPTAHLLMVLAADESLQRAAREDGALDRLFEETLRRFPLFGVAHRITTDALTLPTGSVIPGRCCASTTRRSTDPAGTSRSVWPPTGPAPHGASPRSQSRR